MSLNSIQLSPALLTELYSATLVLTDDGPETAGTRARTEQPAAAVTDNPPVNGQNTTEPPSPAPGIQAPVSDIPAPGIQFLGRNSRHFVILVHYPDTVHIDDQAFEFLSSVLKACQLNAADVAIVNLARQSPDFIQIKQELQPAYLVGFGIRQIPDGLPIGMPELVPSLFDNVYCMVAPSLDHLRQNTEAIRPLKRQLWEGLKKMLGI